MLELQLSVEKGTEVGRRESLTMSVTDPDSNAITFGSLGHLGGPVTAQPRKLPAQITPTPDRTEVVGLVGRGAPTAGQDPSRPEAQSWPAHSFLQGQALG